MHASINPQLRSRLLLAPYDIRRAIYAHLIPNRVHVFLRGGKVHLSVCVASRQEDHDDGFERKSTPSGDSSDSIWARRLRSSWGPHWKCEEVASSRVDDNCTVACGIIRDIFLVCKTMYIDVAELLADIAVFNITDPNTLDRLLKSTGICSSGISLTSGFLASVFPCIKELDITLRLPLADCKALDNPAADSTPDIPLAGSSTAGGESQLAVWLQLCPAIAQLKSLRKLRIWLDHADISSWSVVNERAILSPLGLLASIPDLDICINLPKLHPRLESPDRHFMEGSPAPTFEIHRRLRQRYHCEEGRNGHLWVRSKIDFPVMLEICEFIDALGNEVTPMTEIEEKERAMWKRGVD
ncbi:hypothetical protein K432DRAFT_252881, partial [Lepidopterella palustris CBS 459.81]